MKRHCLLILFFLISWIFTTAQVPGSVVAYSPAASGLYIGSPSICILSNGDYLASHDLFGPKSNEFERPNSRIYRSKDKGKTWTQISEINGQFWSKLFVHEKGLYFMGTSKHHGNTIIRKSTDGGVTWTEPTDGENGLLLAGEYHCAPMPLIEHNGRLWRAMEDAMGSVKKWGKRYGAFMMSIPLGADPMKAANWTSSNVLRYDSTLLNGNFGAWIEGNAVVDPTGQLWDVLRVDDKSTLEEKAAFVKISADGKTATFDSNTGFVKFPGGSKKFSIRYDPKSKLYWTIANYIPQEIKAANPGKNPASIRNTQALFSSEDLRNWDLRTILLQHPEIIKHGFQYVDWLFEGKDIIFLSRTAFDDGQGGAHNNHDANYLTFHRIKKFRKMGVKEGH
ncbi:sialidase family protein [Runella salmonicolor]|uniref:Glycoside hydrolase n=1 Tax=Runella salmonicolor TaxID=2950278 RepID=A0ABT1FMS5_9BACT|nr:sialidase family protein [Runella salmonicolor]MCP1382820.1 glycoside hydrolase [Runella salmonicolor]